MKIIFREAVAEDVDALVRLANRGGPEGKPRMQLPNELPEAYWQAFATIDQDPHQNLMVAELDGKIVGTFHLSYITYLAGMGRPDLQIEAVHVAAEYRGQGIGTKMMAWAIDQARERNCRRVQLTTDKRRQDAHRFYDRLGFSFTHEGAKLLLTPA